MYNIIRLVIGCLFGVISIIILKRRIRNQRIVYAVSGVVSVALMIGLIFYPFENLFITFSSPQEAYTYCTSRGSNIELVIKGDCCDFIVDRKGNTDTYLIIPKDDYGWKIGIGSHTNRIIQKQSSGIVVSIYQYRDTNDYFITLIDTNGGESNIFDEHNTDFYSLSTYNETLKKTFVTYYAHISQFDSAYILEVNGVEFIFE